MPLGRESELKILLSLKDKASAKLESFDKKFGRIANNIAKGALLAGGAVAIGLGVKAVKSAVDFEKAMGNVATLVDTATESMTDMGKKVKEIAKKVPVDIADLTTALYDVRSAGISAADAMDVLETSAVLAVAGLSTTQEATNLLTSAINVYGDASHDANAIAEILFKTVKYGKTTVAELSQGFGKVAAIAKETGISIEDLSAATALLTVTGISASEAQVALKAMISNVLKPTKDAKDAAAELGIQFNLAALEADGLSGMLVNIVENAGDNKQALADLFGSVEAANAIFALTSEEGGAAFLKILADMETESGALKIAFDKQNSTMAAQWKLLTTQLSVALMDLGTRVLPTLMGVVETLTTMIDTVQWLYGLWHGNITATSDAMTTLEVKIVTYMETFKEVVGILQGIATWSQKAIEGLTGVSAYRALSGVSKRIGGLLGFQQGGVVPGPIGAPIPAIVHGGETIIPTGKSAGIVINITGNTFMSDEEAAIEIGDQIIERVKLQQRL